MFNARILFPALLLIITMAGCVDGPDHSLGFEPLEEDESDGLELPRADELRVAADAHAAAWNREAVMILVSTFEGNVPADGDGAAQNPWTGPYVGQAEAIGDGRASRWSFSYAAPDSLNRLADDACEAGLAIEARETLVVTVDDRASIVSSFVTTDDDEGGPMTAEIPEGLLSSVAAAQRTHTVPGVRAAAEAALWGHAFLAAGWYQEGPVWEFTFRGDAPRYSIGVDALNGDIVWEGQEPPPRC